MEWETLFLLYDELGAVYDVVVSGLPAVEHADENLGALTLGTIREMGVGIVVDEGIDGQDLVVDLRVEVTPTGEGVDMLGELCGGDAVLEFF